MLSLPSGAICEGASGVVSATISEAQPLSSIATRSRVTNGCRPVGAVGMRSGLLSISNSRLVMSVSTSHKCTAPGFLDTRVLLCGDLRQRAIPSDACVVGTAQAVLLDQPLRVVARDEGADEALDHPVRFRLTDEGVARGDAPEADLPVEVLGQKSAAVIVTQCEAAGGAGADPSERGANRHADRLRSGVAVAALDNIPAQHFRIPVLDDAEQPDFAVLHGDDLRRIGRPHHVGSVSDDMPV